MIKCKRAFYIPDEMIAKLTGKIDSIFDDSIIIDVEGIGYQVYISSRLKEALTLGQKYSIRILHIFKQEAQYFCGFQDEREMNTFKALLEVQGVGTKSAMSILSTLSIEEFAMAIIEQDTAVLCSINGVGKKTAERILLELKDKTLLKMKDACIYQENPNVNDAILGLISLGYQKNSIMKTIKEVSAKLGNKTSTNELIIECLKEIK
ncbi:MAG: Holliday junction branch migration protein RuvA [Holosporales bacterium]|jgi:Holliday junction DNA helicase RuvA|nr:Holliday junction branch migration protein RuvA [Holosporales bacterium]